MNESRVVTLVYSVACLIMGLSLAQWLGDTVAAACLFIAALMSWLQWQVAAIVIDLFEKGRIGSALAHKFQWLLIPVFIIAVLSAAIAVARILIGLLA